MLLTKQFHYIRWFDPETNYKPWLPWALESDHFDADASLSTIIQETLHSRNQEELYDIENDPGEFAKQSGIKTLKLKKLNNNNIFKL